MTDTLLCMAAGLLILAGVVFLDGYYRWQRRTRRNRARWALIQQRLGER